MALAACSQAGSGGVSLPTASGSVSPPTSVTRSPAGSRTGGAGAATGTPEATTSTSATTSAEPTSAEPTRAPTTTSATTTSTKTTTATTTTATTTTGTETRTVTTTATVPPPSAGTSPTTPATAPASQESTGEVPWWAWLLLVAAVVGLIALIPLLAGRRRRALAAWDQPMADAERAAGWLQDRALPAVLAEPDPVRSTAAWSATRPRFLELDEQLTELARTAPDPERRDMAGSLRAALADVAAALDERSAATSPQDWAAAQTRVELARERLERRLAHEPLVPPGTATAPAPPATVPIVDGVAAMPRPPSRRSPPRPPARGRRAPAAGGSRGRVIPRGGGRFRRREARSTS